MNSAILTSVELLIMASLPQLGKWMDASAITYTKRLDQISQTLKALRVQAKALDLLVAVPGV